MPDITVTISDAQYKALTSVANTPDTWAANAVERRADSAIAEIVALFTEKALDNDVAIPSTRAEIVNKAFELGWVTDLSESSESSEV